MLPIHWMVLNLDIPGSEPLFGRAVEFWSSVTGTRPQGTDPVALLPQDGAPYLQVRHREDGAELGQGRDDHDGSCELRLLLAPGSSLDETVAQAESLGAAEIEREDGAVLLNSPGGLSLIHI